MLTNQAWLSIINLIILILKIQILPCRSLHFLRNVYFSDGRIVPSFGFTPTTGPLVEDTTMIVIRLAFKLIEASKYYSNENEIGNAISKVLQKGEISRESLLIATRLWNTQHRPHLIEPTIKQSLFNLGLEYLDICILHWPTAWKPADECKTKTEEEDFTVTLEETYKAMEELVSKKLVRRLGLSNFNLTQIKRIMKIAQIKPQILETEVHPYMYPSDLIEYCQQNDIVVFSNKPMYNDIQFDNVQIHSNPSKDPIIQKIATKHKTHPIQIILRFLHQNGIIPMIKSLNPNQLVSNRNIFTFELTDQEMKRIKNLNKNFRTISLNCKNHREYPF